MVTAFMGENPDARAEQTIDEAVQGPSAGQHDLKRLHERAFQRDWCLFR